MPYIQIYSGPISLADINNVFGGGYSLRSYFRGGAFVANTALDNFATYAAYVRLSSSWSTAGVYWGGVKIAAMADVAVTSYTADGYTYKKGEFVEQVTSIRVTKYYTISRHYSLVVLINQGIPTSGAISLSQFYGARKP